MKSKTRRLAAFDSLVISSYRFLLIESLFTMTGFQARLMAQAWLVLEVTNSDAWVGIVNGLPAIPVAALALFGGVMADRMDRARMLVWTRVSLAALGLLTAFLITTDVIELWHLIALSFFVAVTQTFGATASQTMIVDVVGRERLFSANALYGATFNIGTFVGPAIGGVLIGRLGVDAVFYLTGGTFVIAALAASQIRVSQPQRSGPATTIMTDLKDGLAYILGTPVLKWMLVLSLGVLFAGVYMPLIPRYARDVLNAGAEGYGTILAAQGIGGLVGVISVILAGNVRSLGLILMVCSLAFASLGIVFAFSTSLFLSSAAAFGFGAVIVWWGNSLRVAMQVSSTDDMRGRVMSMFAMLSQMLALAWLLGGALSEVIGPRATIISGVAVCAGIYTLAYVRSPELRAVGK